MAANVKAIATRIEGCQKNIAKVQGTLKKHQDRLEKKRAACVKLGIADPDTAERGDLDHDQYWALCDYKGVKTDIRNNERKLAELEAKLAKYLEQKEQAEAKNDVPIVPSVEEFLANWREQAHGYYWDKARELHDWLNWYSGYYKEQLQEMRDKYGYIQATSSAPEMKAEREQRKVNYQYKDKYVRDSFPSIAIRMEDFLRHGDEKGAEEFLNKTLDQEVINKRVDLFIRCEDAIGAIVDASGLQLGGNGSINGYVIGERGKAWVETILAGGYNIQCLHYRVLIKRVKED